MDYIIRTLQSHHWGHCECTEYFLTRKTAKKLAWKIMNVIPVPRPVYGWVLCPCPCSVFAVYQPGTPPLAPSGTVWTLAGSIDKPSGPRRNPRYSTDWTDHSHFSALAYNPCLRRRRRTSLTWSWCLHWGQIAICWSGICQANCKQMEKKPAQ